MVAIALSLAGVFEYFAHFGRFGYLGAFIAGLFIPFTFTTPLATASFFYLGQSHNVLLVALIGGIGTVFTDLFILRTFKGGIFTEMEVIWKNYENNHPRRRFTRAHVPHLKGLFQRRPFHLISHWTGAFLLFSPVPDEIGLEMLGYYDLKPVKLIPIAFTSGVVAIWFAVTAGRLVLG